MVIRSRPDASSQATYASGRVSANAPMTARAVFRMSSGIDSSAGSSGSGSGATASSSTADVFGRFWLKVKFRYVHFVLDWRFVDVWF